MHFSFSFFSEVTNARKKEQMSVFRRFSVIASILHKVIVHHKKKKCCVSAIDALQCMGAVRMSV